MKAINEWMRKENPKLTNAEFAKEKQRWEELLSTHADKLNRQTEELRAQKLFFSETK